MGCACSSSDSSSARPDGAASQADPATDPPLTTLVSPLATQVDPASFSDSRLMTRQSSGDHATGASSSGHLMVPAAGSAMRTPASASGSSAALKPQRRPRGMGASGSASQAGLGTPNSPVKSRRYPRPDELAALAAMEDRALGRAA